MVKSCSSCQIYHLPYKHAHAGTLSPIMGHYNSVAANPSLINAHVYPHDPCVEEDGQYCVHAMECCVVEVAISL